MTKRQKPVDLTSGSIQIASRMFGECEVRADSFNEETRTVEIIWAAGAAVKRYSWDEGYFLEQLSMDPKHIRLDRFSSSMSLLDSHDGYGMDNRLGVVVPGSVRIENGKAYAKVKLSKKQRAEELMQDLRDGMGFPVSVGYKTHAYEKREGSEKALPTLLAIDWEPMELSAVPIPADAGAHSRSHPPRNSAIPPDNIIQVRVTAAYAEKKSVTKRSNTTASEPEVDEVIDRSLTPTRRERMANRLGLPQGYVARTAHLDDEEYRLQALTDMPEPDNPHRGFADLGFNETRIEERATTAIAVLLGAQPRPGEAADLVGRSALGIGRAIAQERGVDVSGMSDREVAAMLTGRPASGYWARSGYHTVSDFPVLLAQGAQRAAQERFESRPSPLLAISKRRDQVDFRPTSTIRPGEVPDLVPINEDGEVKSGTLGLESEALQIATFGRMIGFTRQALVNDDLGVLADLTNAFADAASRKVGDELFAILSANSFGGARLGDGQLLFHASRGNKAASGSALSEAGLTAAEVALRTQKGVSGGGLAGSAPVAIVVGPALAVSARKLVAAINAASTADVNPFSNLSVIVEDRVPGSQWWVVGDRPPLQHGFLQGQEGVVVESRDGWRVLGTEFRAVLHFGAAPFDARSIFFNPGP